MDNLSAVIEILGAQNAETIKTGIAQLLIDRVSSDLESWDSYLLSVEAFEELVSEAFEECKVEVKAAIKEKMLQAAVSKLKDIDFK